MIRRVEFLRRQDGSTVVEYAIFLALLVAAMFVASRFVGMMSRETFQQVAQRLDNPSASHSSISLSNSLADSSQEAMQLRHVQVRQLAAVLGVMAFGVLAWFWLYIRRRKETSQNDAESILGNVDMQKDLIFRKRQLIFKTLSENVQSIFAGDIQVGHLISRRLTTVLPTTSAKEVHIVMKSNRLRHLLVCSEDRKLLGIISIRDLHKGPDAKSMMTANPYTVEPTALLGPTITTLIHNRISCLPVATNGDLVGIVTTTDILMGMQGIMQILRKFANDPNADAADTEPAVSEGWSTAAD